MSSFTAPIRVTAVRREFTGWRHWLPPGLIRPRWEVAEPFEYAVGSLKEPAEIITVPAHFRFDGASVPLLLRILFPMAHPQYLQAAALHDFMYVRGTSSRRYTDKLFLEALKVLGVARPWRWGMYWAVRVFGGFYWYLRYRRWEGR